MQHTVTDWNIWQKNKNKKKKPKERKYALKCLKSINCENNWVENARKKESQRNLIFIMSICFCLTEIDRKRGRQRACLFDGIL